MFLARISKLEYLTKLSQNKEGRYFSTQCSSGIRQW